MKNSRSNRDLYQEVTDKIVSALESGTVPWHKPWGFGIPAQNHFSGHVYRGVNAMLFSFADLPTPYFATFDQISKAGGKVKKGAKSYTVYFSDLLIYKDKKRISEQEYRKLPKGEKENCKVVKVQKPWPVFNMGDTEGVPVKPNVMRETDANNRLYECDSFLECIPKKPEIEEKFEFSAYYNPATDKIVMPLIDLFNEVEGYYATLFHELAHATGHPSRLNRDTLSNYSYFGSENYSKEELTAEICACFVCNRLGIDTYKITENAHAYIAGWLKELKNDKRLFWEACTAAQKAFEFLTAD